MLRATHSVMRGTWYWEAQINELPEGGAVRLGWAQEYANLQVDPIFSFVFLARAISLFKEEFYFRHP